MKIKKLIYCIFLSFVFFNTDAQEAALNKADRDYNKYAYVDAIAIYEKLAETGYKEEKIFQRLGNAYYFNAELIKALKWYNELFFLNNQQDPEYYYRYAQTLKSVGDYSEADKMLEIFNQKIKTDSRGVLFENNKNYLEQIKLNSGRFEIGDSGINSIESDYGGTMIDGKLVFASARDTARLSKNTFRWTNRSFTNLYTAVVKSDGSLETPLRLDKKINSKFNESTPVFTKDGNTIYFTRNNFLAGKRGKDDKKVTLLKLYKAELVKDKWTHVVELPFNSDQYSIAHPALSIDEKKLFFASDMPGGQGQSDLYSVTINTDGTFGKPENLGSVINTEGRETFPFISGDNELYFASDGRPGLGGLDIFVAKIKDDAGFGDVQNIGEPVNTKFDDFSFIIDNTSRKGFFSSNKSGGIGSDDIYKFTETRKLDCNKKILGVVVDSKTDQTLSDAKVILLDSNFQQILEVVTGKDGMYTFEVTCNKNYYVRVSKQDFETHESVIKIGSSEDEYALDVKLEKQIKKIELGTDLAKILDIPLIYFDLDESFITTQATFELEKVLAVMKQYPKMKIDVRSHTDSRTNEKYNLTLSYKRAKSTVEWFVKKGISNERITGRGYGESQLVNRCSDNVICTEEEHKLNRRSEFIVLSIK